ncbi:MAG: c-type cytochrome [Vicinamibacteraceae bacterium]
MSESSAGRRRRGSVRAGVCALLVTALTLSILTVAEPARPAAPGQSAPSQSAWAGVFNKEQVERGRTVYNAQCARCHGETLGGGETSPALVDDVFFTFWGGKTVGDLVEYTRTTMPSDGPGKITRKRCIDIAAYLLSTNGFPDGDTELPTELAALNQIAITRTK